MIENRPYFPIPISEDPNFCVHFRATVSSAPSRKPLPVLYGYYYHGWKSPKRALQNLEKQRLICDSFAEAKANIRRTEVLRALRPTEIRILHRVLYAIQKNCASVRCSYGNLVCHCRFCTKWFRGANPPCSRSDRFCRGTPCFFSFSYPPFLLHCSIKKLSSQDIQPSQIASIERKK